MLLKCIGTLISNSNEKCQLLSSCAFVPSGTSAADIYRFVFFFCPAVELFGDQNVHLSLMLVLSSHLNSKVQQVVNISYINCAHKTRWTKMSRGLNCSVET